MELQQFGISNKPKERLSIHKKNGWELLDTVGPADGLWVLETETALKRFFAANRVLLPRDHDDKFDGYTESWRCENIQFRTVAAMLSALRDFEDSEMTALGTKGDL